MEKVWSLNWPVQLTLILLVTLGIPAFVAVLIIWSIRRFHRALGLEQHYKNGIVLTDKGIEYLGIFSTGTQKKAYSEIDSVELISYGKYLIFGLFFLYGFNAYYKVRTIRLTGHVGQRKILVVKFKHPNPYKYIFFAPMEVEKLFEQLSTRIKP